MIASLPENYSSMLSVVKLWQSICAWVNTSHVVCVGACVRISVSACDCRRGAKRTRKGAGRSASAIKKPSAKDAEERVRECC